MQRIFELKKHDAQLNHLLISRLNDLISILEEDEDSQEEEVEFSSKAIEVIRILKLFCSISLKADDEHISSYGMALLSVELGDPESALDWWEKDIELARSENHEIGHEEAALFIESFEAMKQLWTDARPIKFS